MENTANSTSAKSGVPAASSAPSTKEVPPNNVGKDFSEDDDEADDLLELDDMLDEFHVDEAPKAGAPGEASRVSKGDNTETEELAHQLQAGMADLLGELENSPELQEQWKYLVKELEDAANQPPDAAAADISPSSAQPPPSRATVDFREQIERTMNRMKESGEEVDATIAESANESFLTDLLKQMAGAEGLGDSEEDFSKMLLSMMEQLTNKDILYEPMKELAEKYPGWLEKNEGIQSKENMQRYREQFEYVKAIVAKFEEPTYRDSSTTDREYIVENMQKMQAAGSPPAELMGTTDADGSGGNLEIPSELEASCPVQ